jgi:hypothetical protein
MATAPSSISSRGEKVEGEKNEVLSLPHLSTPSMHWFAVVV